VRWKFFSVGRRQKTSNNDKTVSEVDTNKFLVFVSTQCVESGELGGAPHKQLFDNENEALRFFSDGFEAGRDLVRSEIAIIEKPENNLIFSAPYIISAAVFQVPPEINSAESAVEWITDQLEADEDVSDYVTSYEGLSIGPYGQKPYSLSDFLSGW
jgi:hypothetical protein